MKIKVKLFAAARELAGSDTVEIEIPEHATVADLRLAVADEFPTLKKLLSHALWAVDAEYAGDSTIINDRSEVALIPPVSGG
jgi:molybdopterin converting factor subunit 1